MKNSKYLIVMFLLGLGLVACNNNNYEPTVEDFQLQDTYIIMKVGETYSLKGEGTTIYQSSSEDEWVATIDGNTITAEHPGTTEVKVNNSSCEVTVKGLFNYVCYEPCLQWGANVNTVKKYMKEKTVTVFLEQYSNNQVLIYTPGLSTPEAVLYMYQFDEYGFLTSSIVVFENPEGRLFPIEVPKFLEERYINLNESDLDNLLHSSYITNDHKTWIGLVFKQEIAISSLKPFYPDMYSCLIYMPSGE